MKTIEEMSRAELCAFIQTHLATKGIVVVLSGGSCVSIYSDEKYVSRDLDLVNIYAVSQRKIREAMKEIEFFAFGRYYKHTISSYLIEFPPGPLAIGDEPIREINEMILPTGTLRLISPTECVKDRLAAYYYWGDRQSLEQAILVALAHQINFENIRRWSASEGKSTEFEQFHLRLEEGGVDPI